MASGRNKNDRSYDADSKAKARGESTINIGEKVFRPARKTSSLIKELIQAGPDENLTEEEIAKLDGRKQKEKTLEQIDVVYEQVSLLLVDDDGEKADREFLEEHLDFEDANEIVQTLMPQEAQAAQAGGQ